MLGSCINCLKVGARVWTEYGYLDHGHDKITIPPKTGGVIVARWNEFSTIDNPLYRIGWDDGKKSVHYGQDLVCISTFRTLAEFHQMIHEQGVRARQVVGPNGGARGCTAYLVDGSTIENYYPALQILKESGKPIETDRIARKPRRSSKTDYF